MGCYPNVLHWKTISSLSPIRQEKDASDHTSITQINQTEYHSPTNVSVIVEKKTEVAKYRIEMLKSPKIKDVTGT